MSSLGNTVWLKMLEMQQQKQARADQQMILDREEKHNFWNQLKQVHEAQQQQRDSEWQRHMDMANLQAQVSGAKGEDEPVGGGSAEETAGIKANYGKGQLGEQNRQQELQVKADLAQAGLNQKYYSSDQRSDDRQAGIQATKENAAASRGMQAALGHERNMMLEENIRLRQEAAARATPAQTKEVSGLDSTLGLLDTIAEQKKSQDTGNISAIQGKMAEFFGVADPQKAAFKSNTVAALAEQLHALSGATISDKERAFLLGSMPNINDQDDVFDAKLQALKQRILLHKNTSIQNMAATGKNVSGLQGQETSQIKVIGGKTYKKVPGGWEEQ